MLANLIIIYFYALFLSFVIFPVKNVQFWAAQLVSSVAEQQEDLWFNPRLGAPKQVNPRITPAFSFLSKHTFIKLELNKVDENSLSKEITGTRLYFCHFYCAKFAESEAYVRS